MIETTTMTTSRGEEVKVDWDGDSVISVQLFGKIHQRSYLDTISYKIVFNDPDAPFGCLWQLTRQELDEIALCGGRVHLVADDLYELRIIPHWWGVEHTMASDGEAPPWPICEDCIGGSQQDAFGFMVALLRSLIERDEDEGGDFV